MGVEREGNIVTSGCGAAVRLDREACRAFRVSVEESDALVAYVCGVLAAVIGTEALVDILGFGTFKAKPYRPVRPSRGARDAFVEVPYLGPVEFSPSALLIRQLRLGALDRALVPRCDALYSAIRKDSRVPRGQIPHLIKAVFKAFTEALLRDNLVSLPSIGCLVVRQRPPTVRYNVETEAVEVFPGDPTLFLRGTNPFLTRIVAGEHPTIENSGEAPQGPVTRAP